jgi:hypothetical protein
LPVEVAASTMYSCHPISCFRGGDNDRCFFSTGFRIPKMVLLDYMAVVTNFHGRRIGRNLFEFTHDEYN